MAAPVDSAPGPDRPFRFLDLAAELRNNIYELTLTHDEQHDPPLHANPALLRTCKQVYDEARDLFYAKSTLHVTVECTAIDHDPLSTTTRILGNGFDPTTRIASPSLLELCGAFPRHATEIGTLRVTTRLARGFATTLSVGYYVFAVVNRFFYALHHHYRRGRLELTLESPECIQTEGACTPWELFWPIAKVNPDVELHLARFDVDIEQRIMSLRRNREAAKVLRFDIVDDWQCFVSKLNLRQLRPGAVCDMDMLRVAQRVQLSYQADVETRDRRMTYAGDETTMSTRAYLVKYFANFVETAKRGAPNPRH